MRVKSILAALFLVVAGLQTVKAQKIILHMPDNQKVEYDVSQLDSITFEDAKSFPEYLACPDENHPHAIDLGLPSGTKWCCCNVGANTPEGYGGYYAWGETTTKSDYRAGTYKYAVAYDNLAWWDSTEQRYYLCTNIGSDIAGTNYDAATVNMGAPWRMPSTAQQQELINNCSRQWTQQNGVNGILVTGRNGGQIFLPAAGYRSYDDLNCAGIRGSYWSSSQNPNSYNDAYNLDFYDDSVWRWRLFTYARGFGLSVRAVRP